MLVKLAPTCRGVGAGAAVEQEIVLSADNGVGASPAEDPIADAPPVKVSLPPKPYIAFGDDASGAVTVLPALVPR